ncbi:hypothetical protein CARUB_v10021780mg, partial [Capsella rubella]
MTIEPKLLSNISHKPIAKDLWDHIRSWYRVTNGPRIQQLQQDLANCQQVGVSIQTYYGRLTKLWDDVTKLRTSFDPLPTLEQVYLNVTQDEDARLKKKSFEGKTENMAFVAQTQRPRSHYDDKTTSVMCTNFGRVGHQADTFFQILGFPEWWGTTPPASGTLGRGGPARANVAKIVANVAVTDADRDAILGLTDEQWLSVRRVMSAAKTGTSEQMSGKILSPSWILDTGATHHLT